MQSGSDIMDYMDDEEGDVGQYGLNSDHMRGPDSDDDGLDDPAAPMVGRPSSTLLSPWGKGASLPFTR